MYGTEGAAAAQAALGPGVAYVRVPVWGGKTLRLLSFALNARRLLKDAGPQVVFSLERTPGAQVYRAGDGCHREFLRRRAPYLSPLDRAAQRLSPFHRVMLLLERRLFTHPGLRRVIANSRQVQDGNHPALWGGPGPSPGSLQRPGPAALSPLNGRRRARPSAAAWGRRKTAPWCYSWARALNGKV